MSEEQKRIVVIAAFNCKNCGFLVRVSQFGFKVLAAPTECEVCGKRSWRFNEVQSEWITEENEAWGETLEWLKKEAET